MKKKGRIEIESLFPGQEGGWISLDWRGLSATLPWF
jgi:hypothetical protein